MTSTPAPAGGFRVRRALVAALVPIAVQVAAIGGGFLVARIVSPSEGGGFEDVAAVAVTFLGIEVLGNAACLAAAGVLLARRRRDTGLGLLAGLVVAVGAAAAFFALAR